MDRTIGRLPYYVERTATADVDEGEDRTIRVVASDESVDRYGDIIDASGWQLANFKRNPIFLWLHQYTAPIGTVPDIAVDGSRLMARVRFAAEGVSAQADELWKLVKAKILRAVSVGFMVESETDFEYLRDEEDRITGIRYLRQELLELSLVSVPANPHALSVARSLSLPDSLVRSALPLNASVTRQHQELRRQLMALRFAGLRATAPR